VIADSKWTWRQSLDPGRWNALEFELRSSDEGTAELRLLHRDDRGGIQRDDATPFRWRLAQGAQRCVVPIGCNPGWSWRREIVAIEVTGPDGFRIDRAALLHLDYQKAPIVRKSVGAEESLLDRVPEARGGKHH
jgi:hypothetical protein